MKKQRQAFVLISISQSGVDSIKHIKKFHVILHFDDGMFERKA